MKIVVKCWIKKCSSECIPSCKRGKNETRIVRICLLINYEIVKVSFFFLSFRNSLFLWERMEELVKFFESYNGNKFDSSLKFCSVPRNKNKNRKFSKEKNKPREKLFFFKRVEEEKRIEFCHCQRLVIYLFQEDYIKKKKIQNTQDATLKRDFTSKILAIILEQFSLFQGDPVFIFYSFDQHKYTSVFFRDMTRNRCLFFFLCCLSDLFSVSLSISLLPLHLHSSSLPARHIYVYVYFFPRHLDACY